MWTVLTLAPKGIYHYSPLEAREVGKLCRRHGATIMIATPTFRAVVLAAVRARGLRKARRGVHRG